MRRFVVLALLLTGFPSVPVLHSAAQTKDQLANFRGGALGAAVDLTLQVYSKVTPEVGATRAAKLPSVGYSVPFRAAADGQTYPARLAAQFWTEKAAFIAVIIAAGAFTRYPEYNHPTPALYAEEKDT